MTAGYNFTVHKNRIDIKVWGGWSFTLAQEFYTELKQHSEALTHSAWIEVVDFNDWQLATPECFKLVSEYAKWAYQNNLQARVIIASEGMKQTIIKQASDQHGEHIPSYFFTHIEAAKKDEKLKPYFL